MQVLGVDPRGLRVLEQIARGPLLFGLRHDRQRHRSLLERERLECLMLRGIQFLGAMLHAIGLEHAGRLPGAQIQDVVHRHIGGIGFLPALPHGVVEQIGHGGLRLLRRLLLHPGEIHRHIAELHAHRRRGQQEIHVLRQAHQTAVVTHHIRAVGGRHVTHVGRAVLAHAEHGVTLGHRTGLIRHIDPRHAVIRQRAQRLTADLHAVGRADPPHLRAVRPDDPLQRRFLVHRIAFLSHPATGSHTTCHCVMLPRNAADYHAGNQQFPTIVGAQSG